MKRIAFILLLSLYTTFSLGVCIQLMYCGGKLKSARVEILHSEEKEKCGKSIDTKDECCTKGCCKTQHQLLKIDDSHIAANYVKAPAVFVCDVDMPMPVYEILALAHHHNNIVYNNSPPPLEHNIPLYVINCTYRI